MFRTLLRAALLLCAPVPAEAAAPAADRVLNDWLAVFNAGDPAALKGYYAKHLNDPNPIFELETAQDTCGLRVEKVEQRTPTTITALLRERCLRGRQRVVIELAAGGSGPKTAKLTPLTLPGSGAARAAATIAGRLAARDEFAGSLLIVRGNKPVLARSWGLADPRARKPITLDTPMLLASAGKMFTAVSILQLVETGKVELDAPLGRYLVDYPNQEMAQVTIRQLLTHRGGTGDIGILGRDEGANRAKVRTIADIVALNGARPPDFAPGTKEDYSNYGFILLGAVIEKVSGRSYRDYVAAHIFSPAGMTASCFPDKDHMKGVAAGYTTFFGAEPKRVSNLDVLPWQGTSAGGGVASANDMRRFFDALKSGKLLSPAMLKLATTPGETPWYGLGFVAQSEAEKPDRRSWGHGGMSYGTDVAVHTYPGVDTTFICMAARDSVCNRLIYAWYLRTFGPAK